MIQVTVLRMNNYIAMVVPANRDYRNNGVSSTETSQLTLNDKLYVGGAPVISGYPFQVGTLDVAVRKLIFLEIFCHCFLFCFSNEHIFHQS